MSENTPKAAQPSDEIDLGQIMEILKRGSKRIFRAFLHLFIYLKKNAIILIGLMVLGAAIGLGLNQIVEKRLKTEIIAIPNLESKEYLYNVVDEINANIKANDTTFFRSMEVDATNLKGLEITVEPVLEKNNRSNMDDDLKYLELLEKFRNDPFISNVVRTEITNKSSLNHRITVTYKEKQDGEMFAHKVMDYINSNGYFKELVKLYEENALERIAQNKELVQQIDKLISGYSEKMMMGSEASLSNRLVVEGDRESDITQLLALKNSLLKDTEKKRLELQEQKEVISIVNFGKKQQIQKSVFGKNIVRIPLIFLTLFFLWSIAKYLNKKAMELS